MIRKRNEKTKQGAIRVLLVAEDARVQTGDMSALLFDALSGFEPEEGMPYAVALCTVPKHRREEIGDWYADLLDELGWDEAVLVAHKASAMLEAGHVAWDRVGGLFLIDAPEATSTAMESPLPVTAAPADHPPGCVPSLLLTTQRCDASPYATEIYRLPASQAHFLASPPHLLELLHAFCRLRAYPA